MIPKHHCSAYKKSTQKFTLYGTDPTAVFSTSNLWPNGSTLNVQFIDKYNSIWAPWQKAWIAKIVTETTMVYANLNFVFHLNSTTLPPNKPCEIRIACVVNYGSYSAIGTDSLDINSFPSESMNFGWFDAPSNYTFTYKNVTYKTPSGYFDRNDTTGGTIMHEFGHALGMLHELQSPYNNPIQWDVKKVYDYFLDPNGNDWTKEMVDFNVLLPTTTNWPDENGSAFDVNSVMKYSLPSTFAINNNTPNFVNNLEQYNDRYSNCDNAWLSYNYPGRNVPVSCSLTAFNKPPDPTPPPTTPNPTPPPQPTPPPTTPNPTPQPQPTPPPTTPNPTPPQPPPPPPPTTPHPTPQPTSIQNTTSSSLFTLWIIVVVSFFSIMIIIYNV